MFDFFTQLGFLSFNPQIRTHNYMKTLLITLRNSMALLLLIGTATSVSAQGSGFTYQGRLVDNGVPFSGTAEFQFTLWNAVSNGTQVAATMPPSTVLNVNNGLFSTEVDFGATPFTGSNRWLQIEVRTTLGPFTTLAPRQLVTRAPYAIHSDSAAAAEVVTSPVPDSLLSSNIARLQSSPTFTGTVTAPSFSGSGSALTGITHLDSASGGPTGALSVDASGHIAIGTNDSGAALQVAGGGTYSIPVFRAAVTNGSQPGLTNMLDPNNIFISGNRAYVTSYSPGALLIFDISNPLQPALLGQAVDDSAMPGSPFQKLSGAEMVFVTNNVAYVTAANDNALTIINVANPATPIKLAEVINGIGGVTNLAAPVGVVVANNRAFVLGNGSSALSIFDVSNPAAPILIKDIVDDSARPGSPFTKMKWPFQMTLAGTRLYITSQGDHAITILDVANPANPLLLGEVADVSVNPASPFSRLRNPVWVEVVGNVAYVAAGGFDTSLGSLTLMDISSPASPTKLAELNDDSIQTTSPFTKLRGAWAVKVINDLAFVTCYGDDALSVIDVSNPSQPRLVKEFVNGSEGIKTLRFTQAVNAQDDTLYVSGSYSTALNMFSLHSILGLKVDNFVGIGTATPRSALDVAGTITASRLNVEDGMRVSGNWNGEYGALEILGDKPTIRFTGGPVSGNQSWLLHVGSDGPGAFEILRRNPFGGYEALLNLATTGNLGLGTVTPQQKVHLSGSDTRLRIQATSSSGYAATEYQTDARTWHVGAGGSSTSAITGKYYVFDANAGVFRMVIEPSGNCGIGTTTPGATLEVRTTSSTGNAIRFGYYTGGEGNLIAGPSRVGIAGGDMVERISMPQGNANVGIGTLSPSQKLHVVGNILASGSICANNGVNCVSDRNAKRDLEPVNSRDVLEKVAALPLSTWSYIADPNVRHLGPMAQDFRAAFEVGQDEKSIATVDADGVALAAIQGLNQKVEELGNELKRRDHENADLKQRLAALEKIIRNQKTD